MKILQRFFFTLLVVEIIIGGNGHFIEFPVIGISIRQAIFIIAMCTWLVPKFYSSNSEAGRSDLIILILSFIAYILIFTWWGIFRGNTGIFTDAVTWMYLLIFFPVIEVFDTLEKMNNLLLWFLRAVVCLAVIQLVILLIFSYSKNTTQLTNIYNIINLVGGGITSTSGTYRVFLSGSIFFQISAIMLLSLYFIEKQLRLKRYIIISLILILTALILGMTRGMWLGFVISIFFLCIQNNSWKRIKSLVWFMIILLIIGTLIAIWKPSIPAALYCKITGVGFNNNNYDESVNYKIVEFSKMMGAIAKRPLFGFGMGETFIDDLGTHMYFHNTYMQFWLKTGIIGLSFFIIFLTLIIFEGYTFLNTCRNLHYIALTRGFCIGLMGVFITTIFNPFISTPMGIVSIVLFLSMLNIDTTGYQEEVQQ